MLISTFRKPCNPRVPPKIPTGSLSDSFSMSCEQFFFLNSGGVPDYTEGNVTINLQGDPLVGDLQQETELITGILQAVLFCFLLE